VQHRRREPRVAVVDDVGDQLAAAAQPADRQRSRVGDLDRLLGQLDRVAPRAVLVARGAELVDAAERRLIVRGDQAGADAVGVDPRALVEQRR
jgi:hypothetical protein